jgi:TolB protein
MKTTIIGSAVIAICLPLWGQDRDITGHITEASQMPAIAVPDFRGTGDAEKLMTTFNAILTEDLADSGVLKLVPKSLYPTSVPQQPQDFKRPSPWLTDWSNAPANANYLAFGYTAVQDGRLVLFGWLFNLGQTDLGSAQVIGKLYFGSLDKNGATKAAHEFAAEILRVFGIKSLTGTKIYFVSDRGGTREIWSMDYDGSNQRPVTARSNSKHPVVSQDGKLLAYSTLARKSGDKLESWQIMIQSVETGKRLPFDNPPAPTNGWPEFMPDLQHLLFGSSLTDWTQIYSANLNGSGRRQLTSSNAIDVSPRVNPKTGAEVLFISGRSGQQQLWRMNIDGGAPEMLTNNQGEVANPAWSPNGKFVAFAWTQGFELGGFNIFIMDIAERKPKQLTKDTGVNENPWWAPDGLHIVYSSKRGKTSQIYSMLADGTNIRQLTTQGNNLQPVWANALQ